MTKLACSHRLVLAVVGALCLLRPAPLAADETWSVDFEAAQAAAAKDGKALLMEFTGSDWCPPCKALHNTVLSTELFLTEAPKHFVLLKLDNPLDKSKQSEKEIAQYQELKKQYEVRGVPTVILADATGKPFVRMVGYGGQPAEAYVADLVAKSKILKQRDELLAQASASEGLEKAKLLDSMLELLDDELIFTDYKDTVQEIIALDGEDQAGLQTKYGSQLQKAEIEKRLTKIRRNGDAEAGLAEIEALIAELKPEGEALQQALYYKAMFLFGSDRDASKQQLLEARKVAPDSKLAENIDRVLKQVFKVGEETPPKEDQPEDDSQ